MMEVDDSPNRCPRCQRVGLTSMLCQACEHFYQTDNDVLDLLAILEAMQPTLPDGITATVQTMIASMREAVRARNPFGPFTNRR